MYPHFKLALYIEESVEAPLSSIKFELYCKCDGLNEKQLVNHDFESVLVTTENHPIHKHLSNHRLISTETFVSVVEKHSVMSRTRNAAASYVHVQKEFYSITHPL